MLHDLGWRDLSDRRRDLRLALLHKVVTGHVAVAVLLKAAPAARAPTNDVAVHSCRLKHLLQ